MSQRPEMHVMVGALFDAAGRVLIARRPPGKHMAGRWEFPGGKLAPGEAPLDGLRRELAEELDVTLGGAVPLIRVRHDYPDRRVLLDVWHVTGFEGTPRGLDGQALEWVALDELAHRDLIRADRPIVTALRLPRVARLISGAGPLATAALRRDAPTTFLWRPGDSEAKTDDLRDAVRVARARGHRVLVAAAGADAAMIAATTGADGLLVPWGAESLSIDPEGSFLVGVMVGSCELARQAAGAGAHFVVVAAGSKPSTEALPALCRDIGVPVFVGWYRDAAALPLLREAGAHGCAIGPA